MYCLTGQKEKNNFEVCMFNVGNEENLFEMRVQDTRKILIKMAIVEQLMPLCLVLILLLVLI